MTAHSFKIDQCALICGCQYVPPKVDAEGNVIGPSVY